MAAVFQSPQSHKECQEDSYVLHNHSPLDGFFIPMLEVDDSKYWSKLTRLVLRCPMSARLPSLSVGQLRQEKYRVWPDHSQKARSARRFSFAIRSMCSAPLLERTQLLSPVLVRFDLMEDWSPNWHLSIAVGEQSRFVSFNDSLYTLVRELSATSLRDYVKSGTGCFRTTESGPRPRPSAP